MQTCTGTYALRDRAFRYCIHSPASFVSIEGGFHFATVSSEYVENDVDTEFSLFAYLGRLRDVSVRAAVVGATSFGVFGLTTRVFVEECDFDVFLRGAETTHGLIAFAEALRVIDARVQVGGVGSLGKSGVDSHPVNVAGLARRVVGPTLAVSVRIWFDGARAENVYGLVEFLDASKKIQDDNSPLWEYTV